VAVALAGAGLAWVVLGWRSGVAPVEPAPAPRAASRQEAAPAPAAVADPESARGERAASEAPERAAAPEAPPDPGFEPAESLVARFQLVLEAMTEDQWPSEVSWRCVEDAGSCQVTGLLDDNSQVAALMVALESAPQGEIDEIPTIFLHSVRQTADGFKEFELSLELP